MVVSRSRSSYSDLILFLLSPSPPRCAASSFPRLHTNIFVLLPPSAYHGVCGLLRARRTFLTRLSGRVFPFIPLVPSSAPPRIVASFPFFFLSLFPRSFLPSAVVQPIQRTRVDLCSDFDETSQVHRANANSMYHSCESN